MTRILIGGAGGAPSNNVIQCLRESGRGDYIIGMSCKATDLLLADCDEKHLVLPAVHPDYENRLLRLLEKVVREMTRGVPELGGLTIGVAAKIGQNWGTFGEGNLEGMQVLGAESLAGDVWRDEEEEDVA